MRGNGGRDRRRTEKVNTGRSEIFFRFAFVLFGKKDKKMTTILLIWNVMKILAWTLVAIFMLIVFVLTVRLYVTEKKDIKPPKEVVELRERVAAELKERRGGYR